MPNWKKVIVSGSDAALNSLNVTTSLTASGLIYPTVDGTANQVIQTDGLGNLSFGSVDTTYEVVKNVAGITLYKGTPVHATASNALGNVVGIIAASASNPATMPATFILNENLADGEEGYAIISGLIQGVDTSAFEEGDVVYVGENSGYTNVKPTGSNLIQNLGIVTKIHPSNGAGIVLGAGRSNDVPNLLSGEVFWGENNRSIQKPLAHILSGSSYAYSGSFVGDGSGLTGITITGSVEWGTILNKPSGIVSSSAQLSTEISGAFTSTSSSLASRTTTLENAGYTTYSDSDTLTYINSIGVVSSSAQITITESQISDLSHYTDSDTLSYINTIGVVSSSAQLSNTTIPGDLTIGGKLTAQEFHTEFVSASILYESGSTQFGDTVDDTHTFIGTLSATTIQNVLSSSAQIDYDSIPNRVTNNNQLTNGAGYTTCIGDITQVTAGTGISGGGTSGTVTVSHADTSTLTGAQGSAGIASITVDALGHVTAVTTATYCTTDTNTTYTANEMLTCIKTVDGASSGLDADLLDGQQGSYYLDYNNFSNKPTIPTNNNQLTNGAGYTTYSDSDTLDYINTLGVVSSSAQLSTDISGAFASTSSSLASRTTTLENAGYTTCIGDITGVTAGTGLSGGGTSGTVTVSHADTSTLTGAQGTSGIASITVDALGHVTAVTTATYCTTDTNTTYTANDMLTCIKTVDGAGSGLDADTLDGQQGSYYLDYNNLSNKPTIPTNNNQLTNGAGYTTYSDSDTLSYINTIGVVSGSAQITLSSATGNLTAVRISDFDTEVSNNTSVTANTAKVGYTDALVKAKLNTESVLSGSITSAKITDVDAFSQSGTYANLRAQGTTASDVGLGNVTNESKATMFTDAALTGNPTAPTQTGTDDSTKIATTAFVQGRIDSIIGTAGSALDTLGELSASLSNDQDALAALTTTVGTKLAKSSNLSDLTNVATARTNLGLGTAATTNSTAYATAAQGTNADTAYSWGDHSLEGYTTCIGDITGVTAGTGLTGGGTSGTVTVSHADTSTLTGAQGSAGIASITVDALGHVTAVTTATYCTTDTNTTYTANDMLTCIKTVDGAGSGLDADTLDGQQGSYYLDYNNFTNKPTIPTNNNQLTNGAGYTTCIGDITGVTAGTGLSGGGTTGDVSLAVDLSELTDMTATMAGTDEFIVLDGGEDRRKAANEIGLSIFNNDSSFTSCTGTVTSVGGTGTVNGLTLTGTVTSTGNLTLGGTLGSITVSQLDGAAVQTSAESFSDSDTVLMTAAAIEDRITGKGYTTCTGDITGVTAGTGITGGGTSGTVTINHSDTSTLNGAYGTNGVSSITVDSLGHVTAVSTATYSNCQGTVTSVATGTGLTGGTITSTGTISLSHLGLESLTDPNADRVAFWDDSAGAFAWLTMGSNLSISGTTLNATDTNTTYSAATMLTCIKTVDGASSGLDADLLDGNEASAFYLATNPSGYTTCVGDITGVTAGTGLSGGGTSGGVTLSVNADQRGSVYYIGQDTNDYIHVNTTVIDFRLDGNLDMRLENDGDLHVDGDVIAYSTTTSDIRFKDNINTIENSLSKIKSMRGVEFVWNAGGRKGEYDLGVIAQEVEEVIPSIVREKKLPMFDTSDTLYKTVDYEKLIPLLIESVKELSNQIEYLKNNK